MAQPERCWATFDFSQLSATPIVSRMKDSLHALLERRPELAPIASTLVNAYSHLLAAFERDNALFTCGNGGSAADAEHIVGELLKSFCIARPLEPPIADALRESGDDATARLAERLQRGVRAHALTGPASIVSAVSNDMGADLVFAQQLVAMARRGDVLVAISTSGNATNVVTAAQTARALGVSVIGLTGRTGGELARWSDHCICMPADRTDRIQELHLCVYHWLCEALEAELFGA